MRLTMGTRGELYTNGGSCKTWFFGNQVVEVIEMFAFFRGNVVLMGAVAVIGAGLVGSVLQPAHAGDDDGIEGVSYYSTLSCAELWHERNAIFADAGMCFKGARAIKAFGAGCQPPFGKLPAHKQNVIKEIRSFEDQKGC